MNEKSENKMKEAIYTKLKQAYSPLGLGEAVLMGQAQALAATGYVTEDNIDAVVAAQQPFLEQLQKANDQRAQTAAAKAKEAAEKAAAEQAAQAAQAAQSARDQAIAEAVAKAIAEERAKAEATLKEQQELAAARIEEKEKEKLPAWYEKERTARDQAVKELRERFEKASQEHLASVEEWKRQAQESLAEQAKATEALKAIQAENERMRNERRSAERMSFISSQALAMGIPQYRVDEGFAGLTPDSTDDEITAKLAAVARNIKANMLPESASRFPMADGKPSESEIKELAKSLVK